MNISRLSLILVMATCSIFVCCNNSNDDFLNKIEEASFTIHGFMQDGEKAFGSGFFIDENGTGITNYHVLDELDSAYIRMANGVTYGIDKVLASDKVWDIVKFSINHQADKKFQYLTFSEEKPKKGDKIRFIGAPGGFEQSLLEGVVSAIRMTPQGLCLQTSARLAPGCSGGPIFNEKGDVVAVAFGGFPEYGVAFGVLIDQYHLDAMVSNPFMDDNPQFNDKNGVNSQDEDEDEEDVEEDDEEEESIDVYSDHSGSWKGTIGNLSVTMNLEFYDDGSIDGVYRYDKNDKGEVLYLSGNLDDDTVTLEEKDDDDNVTGSFLGKLDVLDGDVVIQGEFEVLSTNKTFPFILKKE